MLLEIAVGDAYGAGFEFAEINESRANDLSQFHQHGTEEMAAGSYTDDTQMSIGVIDAMMAFDRPSALDFANAFVKAYRRDPRPGYSRRFRALLDSVRDGDDLISQISGKKATSGAAMRACPIGLYDDVQTVMDVAHLQARVTHDNDAAAEAAIAAALASHYFAYRLGEKEGLPDFLASHVGPFWREPHEGPVDELGRNAVRAAVTAIVRATSLSELLRIGVDFTGDVDTVCAIGLGAGHMSADLAADLPPFLLRDMEDGHCGRTWIASVDAGFMDRFPCPARPAHMAYA